MLTSYDKNYLRIGFPAALEGVLMVFLCNADIIMVGTLGTGAIAAVSIFTQPRMILLTVARSVAAAVTILIAERFGREQHDTYGDVLKKTLILVVIVLGLAHVCFFICLDSILLWMGAQHDYLSDAMIYGLWTLPPYLSHLSRHSCRRSCSGAGNRCVSSQSIYREMSSTSS